jgi:HK97 gp10 family phage protein
MSSSDFEVKGLVELKRALDDLPNKIQNNIMRGAMRAGAKVLAEEAARNIHSVSGTLADSIRVSTRMKGDTVVGRVVVGDKGKKGRASAFYARFVEFGTAAHVIKARAPNRMLAVGVAQVQHPGARKKPFLRPALDSKGRDAVEAMREYVRRRLSTKHGIEVPAPLEPGDE